MKQNLLKRVALLALCMCLVGVFVSLTPAKAAHAASAKAASSCSDDVMLPNNNDQFFAADQNNMPIMQATSCAGTSFALIYQTDGNLVLYAHYSVFDMGTPIWATGTDRSISPPQVNPGYVVFQGDGNFVLYNDIYFFTDSYHADWASNTSNRGATQLRLQADGNLVIYRNSTALWATNTCCWA